MTMLSETAHPLVRPHTRATETEDGTVYAEEPALLDLLRRAVASDTVGRGSAAGVSRTGSPIDCGALDLWNSITRQVNLEWPYAGDLGKLRWSLPRKLDAWATYLLTPEEEARLLAWCLHWTEQIRELLEPTKRVPLRDTACPRCHCTHVTQDSPDGEVTHDAALMSYPDAQPPYAECRVCPAKWVGGQLLDLRAELDATLARAVA